MPSTVMFQRLTSIACLHCELGIMTCSVLFSTNQLVDTPHFLDTSDRARDHYTTHTDLQGDCVWRPLVVEDVQVPVPGDGLADVEDGGDHVGLEPGHRAVQRRPSH